METQISKQKNLTFLFDYKWKNKGILERWIVTESKNMVHNFDKFCEWWDNGNDRLKLKWNFDGR